MNLPNLKRGLQFATYEAGLIQAQAYRALKNYLTQQLATFNLSMPEWALLGQIYKHRGGLRLSGLSEMLSVEPSLATNLVNALERKGWVKRRHDPSDGRARQVFLTPKGESFVLKVEAKLHGDMQEFLGDIKRRDLAQYLTVLERIAAKA